MYTNPEQIINWTMSITIRNKWEDNFEQLFLYIVLTANDFSIIIRPHYKKSASTLETWSIDETCSRSIRSIYNVRNRDKILCFLRSKKTFIFIFPDIKYFVYVDESNS